MQLQLEDTVIVTALKILMISVHLCVISVIQRFIYIKQIKKEVYESKIKSLRDKINKNAIDDEDKFKVQIYIQIVKNSF